MPSRWRSGSAVERRALRLSVVDRIEEVPASAIRAGAGQLRVQLGEAILPVAGVGDSKLPGEKVRLFRLNDGSQEVAYCFQEVIDLSVIDHDVIPADLAGEVSGVTLIGGEPAELVDAHWLFANHVGAAAEPAAERPVCRLPANDPWMQNMLRPIVEAAGYWVVGEDDEAKADLVIVSEDAKVEKGAAAKTIRLRSEPEAANPKDRSIYRYDRAALVLALKSAGARGR